jgi:hypothetical protein
VGWVPWIVFGYVGAAGATTAPIAETRRLSRWIEVALIAAAILGATSGAWAFVANHEAGAARSAWRERLASNAVAAASSAVGLDGGRADNWNWLGLGLELAGSWRQAGDAFAAAASRAPHEAVYWSNLAKNRVRLATAGEEDRASRMAALDAAQKGVDADPNAAEPRFAQAEVANALGDLRLALDSVIAAVKLYRLDDRYERLAIDVALRLADASYGRAGLAQFAQYRDGVNVQVALGRLSLRLGDRVGAEDHAYRGLALDPGNADATALLNEARTP